MVKMGVKMNDGSCVRLRPRYRDHVWSYDFVHHRTDDGRVLRTLNILDEFSGECLEIRVKRKLNATDVVNTRFRDQLLNGEIVYTLQEAQIIIEQWRIHYNTIRPHSVLGCRPPALESIIPMDQRPIMH